MGNLIADHRIMTVLMLNEWDMRAGTLWLKIGTSFRLHEHGNEHLVSTEGKEFLNS